MKTSLLLLSAALITTSQADLVIKQAMDGPMKGDVTMSIKGNRIKTEMGKDFATIMDAATGDSTTIMHAQKMIMKSSGAQMKAQAKALADEASLTATGVKEKVGEYDCEVYNFVMAGTTMKMWVAKDYPNYASFKSEMETAMSSLTKGSKKIEFPGMVVKSVAEVAGQKMTSTVISVKTEAVDESIFALPADYKAMEMPK
jgi:Domain of unknown function (DUF4412)